MKNLTRTLKSSILREFSAGDRKGVYSLTQKLMAYNSNKIEGSTLTSEQTAMLFDTGTVFSENERTVYKAKDIEEMTGHFKMFNEVLKSLDKPLDYANGYPVGEYKNRANQVSDIETELPQNIHARMEALILKYNSGKKQLADIAEFHAEYERIHPFQDGNGRTGRAIILKQCLDSDIMPVIITDNDKAVYYSALHKAQIENELKPLLDFFEREQAMYYEKIKKFIV